MKLTWNSSKYVSSLYGVVSSKFPEDFRTCTLFRLSLWDKTSDFFTKKKSIFLKKNTLEKNSDDKKATASEKHPLASCLVSIYLLNVNHRNTRKKCEICPKLAIKTPFISVCFVIFEHVIRLAGCRLQAGWFTINCIKIVPNFGTSYKN